MAELNNTVVRGNLIAMGRIVTDNASFGTINVSRLTSNSVTANQVFMGEGGAATISSTTQTVAANAVSSTASRTYIVQKDSSGNLVVNVPWSSSTTTTGDIVATGTNDIWKLTASGGPMSVNIAVSAYPTAQSDKLSFDIGETDPTRTDRLNLNGYLYATKLYSDGKEVSTINHTHNYSTTDTKNTVGGYVKNATKLYPVGITATNSETQSYHATSYSNSNVYIGTDNCLYSNNEKVLTVNGGTLSGSLDVSGYTLKINTVSAPTSSGGTEYGTGDSGQVLKSNGTTVYWASDSNSTNVRQYTTTTDAYYPVILAYDDSLPSSYETQYVRKSANLKFNPSSGTLNVNGSILSKGTEVSLNGHNHDDVYSKTDTTNTVGATANTGVKLWMVGVPSQTDGSRSYTQSNTFVSSSGLFNTPGIYTNKFQAPTTNGGTTYGQGNSGQVLMTNGSNIYWGTITGGSGGTTDNATHEFDETSGILTITEYATGANISGDSGTAGPTSDSTLSHGGTVKIPYIVASNGLVSTIEERTITLPSDKNTHYTTHLYAGSGSAANAATTNGNTKLTVTDNSTVRNSVTIKGTGTTSVTSDANGVITINSTNSGATVTLNGQSTSSASFYAPTTVGTEGMFLMSNGSGAPTWESISLNSGHLMADQLTVSGTATVNGQFSSSTRSYFNAGLTSYGDVTIGKSTSGNDLTIYGSIYDGYGDEFATESWVTQNFVAKCLLEGTQITMFDNSLKNIEDVKPGDIVKSIDIETGEETESVVLLNSVGDVKNYYYMLMFEDGSCLKTNWTHDVYNATKETWVKSDCELYLDDEIIKSDGNRVKFIGTIDTIGTPNGRMCKFYDIVVSNNCYYADNILCSSNPITQYRWLNPVLNKRAKFHPVPETLKEIISSYKDEDNRESDLVHNEEYIKKYIPSMALKMKKEAKLRALKAELVNTDYVTLKMSEGVEVTPAVQETLDARAWWRKLYNEIEAELNVIYEDINKLKVQYSILGEDVLLDNMSLRKKFFLESCNKANKNLQKFIDYYKPIEEVEK